MLVLDTQIQFQYAVLYRNKECMLQILYDLTPPLKVLGCY
jgi:uncharacterized protein involved in propanediol utilization